MENLDLLYDHYKDSFNLSKKEQEKRNKNFVILCLLEALAFMSLLNSNKAYEVFNNIINYKIENPIPFSNTVLQTLLWILILYFSIRYCQNNIYIERQYDYIHNLEKTISSKIPDYDFNRESTNYLSKYPFVLEFIGFFYTWIIPILFISINSIRCIIEIKNLSFNISLILDVLMYIATVILTISYIVFMKSDFIEKKIKKINKWSKD